MRILADLRYAFRSLARSPLLVVAAVVSLGLGIGAATVVFRAVDGVILSPLPYPEGDRLFMVWEAYPDLGYDQMWVSHPNFEDLAAGGAGSAELAAYRLASLNLSGSGDPERLQGARMTPNLLAVLGVAPQLGRPFSAAEHTAGNDRVALLSHALWEQRFAADPAILGRDLILDGISHTVVGVMPAGFRFPSDVRVWVPLTTPREPARRAHNLEVVARLGPDASRQRLAAELAATASDLAATLPESNRGMEVQLVSLREHEIGTVRPALLLLCWGVALLLVIAFVNVANLLLARMMARRGELATRLALGESRWRLARRMLVESGLLALPGLALGLVLAALGILWLPAVAPPDLPRLVWGTLGARELACAAAIALGGWLLTGPYPALWAARLRPEAVLEAGGGRAIGHRRSLRFLHTLTVTEIALSVMLVISTGLLLRSASQLARTDPGLRLDGLVTAQLSLPLAKYRQADDYVSFHQRLLAELKAQPEVAAAALSQVLPLTNNREGTLVAPAGATDEEERVAVSVTAVSADYFPVLGIPVVAGRSFDARDNVDAAPVAIVSESLARRLWPGVDAVGKKVQIALLPETARTVIGVVGDVRQVELKSPAPAIFYLPLDQPLGAKPFLAMMLRLRSPMTAASLQRVVGSVDPQQPLYDLHSGAELVASALILPRFWAVVLTVFATVALLLTLVGVYAVVSFAVSLRAREMAVRVAMGAAQADIRRLVVRSGLDLGIVGVVLGLAGSLLSTRLLRSLLHGVEVLDPWTLGATLPLVLVWCGLASYLPARRAARFEPQTLLRDG